MIKNELKSTTIYLLGVISVVSFGLAYQVKRPFEIDLGQRGDNLYLDSFWDVETVDGLSYRWTRERSYVFLPGIGGYASAVLRIRVNGSRPEDLPLPTVTLVANGREVASFTASNEFETYEFDIDRTTVGVLGDLQIEINSEFFVPAEVVGGGDLRKLGVLVDYALVQFEESASEPVLPAPIQTLHLVGSVLAIYLLALRLVQRRSASLIAIAVLTVWSLVTAFSRMSLMPCSFWVFAMPAMSLTTMELVKLKPRTVRSVTLAIVLAMGVVWTLSSFASLFIRSASGGEVDFRNNYTAALLLRQGGLIYDLEELARINETVMNLPLEGHHGTLFTSYDNPPFTAVLVSPLTFLGFRTATATFVTLNTLFLLCAVGLLLWARRQDLPLYPQGLIALLLALNLDPVHHSILLGQFDSLILLLLAVAYCAYQNHRDVLAGCSLGLATMIKVSPALLALYFLYKRRYRIFLFSASTMIILVVISWMFAGTQNWTFFIINVVPALLKGSAHMENQSLNGFFNRLFVDDYFVTHVTEAPPILQVRILTLLASLFLFATTAWLVRKRLVSRDNLRFDLQFALVVIALPILSSIAWDHYMTWYIIPFVALLNPRLREWLSLRSYLLVLIGAALVYGCLYVPMVAYWPMALQGTARLLLSLRMYGALLLYGLLSYVIVCYDRPAGHPMCNNHNSKVPQ